MNRYKVTCANCRHVFYTINPNLLDKQKYCLQCNIGLLSIEAECPECKGTGLKDIGDKHFIPKCRNCSGNGFVFIPSSDKKGD